MKLKLLLNKSLEENAEIYFKKSKKLKKKIPGAEKAIEQTKKKLESAKLIIDEAPQKLQKIIIVQVLDRLMMLYWLKEDFITN